MEEASRQLHTLVELDARHDDLLVQLDELDRRVSQVLVECQAIRLAEEPSQSAAAVEIAAHVTSQNRW